MNDMSNMTNTQFCQSCGMPLTAEDYGAEADGSPNTEYCKHCYKDGAFTPETRDVDMQGMIDLCAPYMVTDERTEQEALEMMAAVLPQLKRWKQ